MESFEKHSYIIVILDKIVFNENQIAALAPNKPEKFQYKQLGYLINAVHGKDLLDKPGKQNTTILSS